jgi:hypothetical protein
MVMLGECPVARAARAPLVVIDERGIEAGVLVDFPEYVSLLGILAARLDRDALPDYWRSALDGCLDLGGPAAGDHRARG